MNLKFSNSFVVLPRQCNWHYPMIFGGAFLAELDLCAFTAVSRLLHDSECDTAVTYKVLEVTFHRAAEAGEIVFLEAEIVDMRHRSVTVQVKAYRERQALSGRDFIAEAKFVFVTKKNGEFHPHGLTMPVS